MQMTIDSSNIQLNPRTPHWNQPKSVKRVCLGSAYPNGVRVGSVFSLITIVYMLCLPVPTQIYIHPVRNVKSIVINRNLGRHPRQHRKVFEFISFLKCVRGQRLGSTQATETETQNELGAGPSPRIPRYGSFEPHRLRPRRTFWDCKNTNQGHMCNGGLFHNAMQNHSKAVP